jgi:hypothetical protein
MTHVTLYSVTVYLASHDVAAGILMVDTGSTLYVMHPDSMLDYLLRVSPLVENVNLYNC